MKHTTTVKFQTNTTSCHHTQYQIKQ